MRTRGDDDIRALVLSVDEKSQIKRSIAAAKTPQINRLHGEVGNYLPAAMPEVRVRMSTTRHVLVVRKLLILAAAPREAGDYKCKVVRVDRLGHVDLKPRQQRQACVVLLDERG